MSGADVVRLRLKNPARPGKDWKGELKAGATVAELQARLQAEYEGCPDPSAQTVRRGDPGRRRSGVGGRQGPVRALPAASDTTARRFVARAAPLPARRRAPPTAHAPRPPPPQLIYGGKVLKDTYMRLDAVLPQVSEPRGRAQFHTSAVLLSDHRPQCLQTRLPAHGTLLQLTPPPSARSRSTRV